MVLDLMNTRYHIKPNNTDGGNVLKLKLVLKSVLLEFPEIVVTGIIKEEVVIVHEFPLCEIYLDFSRNTTRE